MLFRLISVVSFRAIFPNTYRRGKGLGELGAERVLVPTVIQWSLQGSQPTLGQQSPLMQPGRAQGAGTCCPVSVHTGRCKEERAHEPAGEGAVAQRELRLRTGGPSFCANSALSSWGLHILKNIFSLKKK